MIVILKISILLLYVTLSNCYLMNNNRYQIKQNCFAKNKKVEEEKIEPDKNLLPKIGLGALVQLVTMGAGAPSLGEFKRWEGSKAIFELEANNFADSDGNSLQLKKKYFLDGYVEEEGEKPPSFFENLLSGGKKMEQWTERIENQKKQSNSIKKK